MPTIIGIAVFTRQKIRAFKKLSVLIFFTFIFQIIAFSIGLSGTNNMWLFHLHTWVETTLLSFIFIEILTSWRKRMTQILIISFFIFSIINIAQLESLLEFNSNQRYIAGVGIIIWILMFYFQLFQEAKIERLEHSPYFILNSSLLIYFTGTLFLFIFGKYVITEHNPEQVTDYWHLHSTFNILLNIGYTFTLWMGVKKST